jgi:hypothetical protein
MSPATARTNPTAPSIDWFHEPLEAGPVVSTHSVWPRRPKTRGGPCRIVIDRVRSPRGAGVPSSLSR